MLAASINNGAHSANGITAMFIACGQDAANVAESSSAISFVDVDEDDNYYIAIPSLSAAVFAGDWVSSHDA